MLHIIIFKFAAINRCGSVKLMRRYILLLPMSTVCQGRMSHESIEEQLQYIKMEDARREVLKKKMFIPGETVIVGFQAHVKIGKITVKQGYVAVTRGAIYIAKHKKSDMIVEERVSLLGVEIVNLKGGVDLRYDDVNIEIKAGDSDLNRLTTAIVTLVEETFFDVEPTRVYPRVKFDRSLVVPIQVKKQVRQAVKWRFAMFMYMQRGVEFDKAVNIWDYVGRIGEKELALVGQTLNPGPYCDAFTMALSMVKGLHTVQFQMFPFETFPKMFTMFLSNARTVREVVLMGYDDNRIFDFRMDRVTRTNVRSWSFERCSVRVINEWFTAIDKLPDGSLHKWDLSELKGCLSELIPGMEHCRQVKNLEIFTIAKMKDVVQPAVDVAPMISVRCMPNLHRISFSGLSCDATELLEVVLSSVHGLHSLSLTNMAFKKTISSTLTLPKRVTYIDVSHAVHLTGTSMRGLLTILTKEPRARPITFIAAMSARDRRCDAAMGKMDMSTCYPTLGEINWNGNAVISHTWFAFLYTQKRLRWLSMNRIRTEDSTEILKCLVQLVLMLPLYGLDMRESGKFRKADLVAFIEAISASKRLRRLNMSFCAAGEDGLRAMGRLVEINPKLRELGADGFAVCDVSLFIDFWTAVLRRKDIVACECPLNDIRGLNIPKDDGNHRAKVCLDQLRREKKRMSNEQQRAACSREFGSADIDVWSVDVFEVASGFEYCEISVKE